MARILLVEDNDMNRDMLSRRLDRRGYDISIAVDGEQALEKVAAELPDLVLLDLNLPKLDGWEVARRLKADEKTQSVPIVALTAHAMEGDAQRAIAAGCDDYDSKPVDLPRLMSKMNALLGPKAPDSSSPSPSV